MIGDISTCTKIWGKFLGKVQTSLAKGTAYLFLVNDPTTLMIIAVLKGKSG